MNSLQKQNTPHRSSMIVRYAGTGICAAVLIFCVFAIPVLFKNPAVNLPDSSVTSELTSSTKSVPKITDTSIIGLPVNNFSLADIKLNVEMDRMACFKLSDFFSYRSPQIFAFVRVTGTEQWQDKNANWGGGWKQNSSLQVLSVLWNRDGDIPETVSVSQFLYGGCVGDEKTNLLREGGVYLLPMYSYEDMWYINGDLDVLFEVDDKGLIWSHSQFEGFSRFDGEDAGILAEAITALTSDENFSTAITMFGRIAWDWDVLVEVTVLSADPGG